MDHHALPHVHLPNTFLEDHREQGDANTLARHCYHLDELPSSLEIMTQHHSGRITHHRCADANNDTCNNITRDFTHKTHTHVSRRCSAFRSVPALNNPAHTTIIQPKNCRHGTMDIRSNQTTCPPRQHTHPEPRKQFNKHDIGHTTRTPLLSSFVNCDLPSTRKIIVKSTTIWPKCV